jgi:hypothetical protein
VTSMGTLQMFVTLLILGGGAIAIAFCLLGIALRWLLRFKRDGGDNVVFTVYLLFLILGAGFLTTAVVGVSIASVEGSHLMPG